MNAKFHFSVLLAFGLFALSALTIGCNQFAEGPFFSFKSVETRIANTWKVKQAAKNSVEITALFDGGFFEFESDYDFATIDTRREVSLPPFSQDTILRIAGVGTWKFLEDKQDLELLYTYSWTDPYNPDVTYSEEANERWEIRRLTEEELWIRNDSVTIKMIPFD